MTKIDVHAGKLSMEVEGNVINFDITSRQEKEEGVLSIYNVEVEKKIDKCMGDEDNGVGVGKDGNLGNNGNVGMGKDRNGIGTLRVNGDGDDNGNDKEKIVLKKKSFKSVKELKNYVCGIERKNNNKGRKEGGVKVDPPIVMN